MDEHLDFLHDCEYIQMWSLRLRELAELLSMGGDIEPLVNSFWKEAVTGIPPADIVLHTLDGGHVRISFVIEVDNEEYDEEGGG